MAGYLRTQLSTFPALKKFNSDVYLDMEFFKGSLHEMEELGLTKEMLGRPYGQGRVLLFNGFSSIDQIAAVKS